MTNDLFEQTLERLLSEQCGPEVRHEAESEGWAGALWDTLFASGLAFVGVPEEAGGSGGTVGDAAIVCRLAGRHGVPLPLAECTLIGGWLVSVAGLSVPNGPISVAVPEGNDGLSLERSGGQWIARGVLRRVPYGRRISRVIALADTREGPQVVSLDPSRGVITEGENVAGEPRDTLDVEGVSIEGSDVAIVPDGVASLLELRGALSWMLLMGGAMEAIAEMTVSYAGEREQFGRPIGSFQAVAHRLVRLVSEAELAVLAAVVAANCFVDDGETSRFVIAAASATVNRAASEVAAQAHQVHGAIGMTQEYPLHHFTRRLWAWRQEWGSERSWACSLGSDVGELGAEALWSRIAHA